MSYDFQVKLADFGFSSLLEGKRGQDKLTTVCGTEGYMAPELFNGEPYKGSEVDLFAAVVLLFIMRSKSPPFVKAS